MQNAPNTKKSISVRVKPESWGDLGEFAEQDRRKKKDQFEVLMNEEKSRRSHINGGKKRK